MWIFIILLGILVLIYFGLPLWAKFIIFIINFVIPDPIPVLDEVLMIVGIISDIKKFIKVAEISEWMENHKFLSKIIAFFVLALIAAIIFLVSNYVKI